MADSPLARWRRRSLRFRLTALAAVALVLAFGVSASTLMMVLGRSLMDTVDETTRQHAQAVRAQADSGTLTDPITTQDGTIVQVIAANGRITHGTYGADRLVPLLPAHDRRRAQSHENARFRDGEPYGIRGRCASWWSAGTTGSPCWRRALWPRSRRASSSPAGCCSWARRCWWPSWRGRAG
ncbi:hypothetical protein [Nonomuraea recticatena]|uniref:hypothetical protein n=1 Tax=Nonomuraea recticatena TaxID=46178 RepID=UPI003617E6E2